MVMSWIVVVLTSIIIGVILTLVIQYYIFTKYFKPQQTVPVEKKIKLEPFQLPKVLLDVIHCDQLITKESCISLNLLLQFLFHELRDAEKVRLWFRKKLCHEFEELLSRSAIGKMVGNIRILEIDLGSEFPVINNISIHNVKVNSDYSHIDTLDLKLDVNYSGGFRLDIEANMLLGKGAHISIKVNELYGEGRLQFTRLPYSHWSFTFYNEPKIQLQVESHFQGRPFHQITNFISSQIKKSLKKKHTLPNYKIRYKPFFDIAENSVIPANVPPGQLQIIIHKISRLNEVVPENCDIYCTAGLDHLPWVEIVNYGKASFYVLDIIATKKSHEVFDFVFRQEFLGEKNQVCVILEDRKPCLSGNQDNVCRDDIILFIDGKKVTSVNQAVKYIKSAAFQLTFRVERKICQGIIEENFIENPDSYPTVQSALQSGLRRRKESESESSTPSPTPSMTGSPANKIQSKKTASDSTKHSLSQKISVPEEKDCFIKILKSKCMLNKQVILFEEYFTFQVKNEDKFLNLNVRCKENDTSKDRLLGFINIPLVEIVNASDTIKNLKLKPPDSFAACNLRTHKLLNHNGFIPLLCFGDVIFSHQFSPFADLINKSVPEIVEPALTPEQEDALGQLQEEKKHDFIKTHFQTSTQCEFCGKKIWFKDAEKCKDCAMTCHKKCVTKCKTETVCFPRSDLMFGGLGELNKHIDGNDDEFCPTSLSELTSSSRESTPQPTPTKKRLGNILASVASASRGLKRVSSVNNLALPGDTLQNSLTRSLPPSPQQSPASSRKASLPLELNEEIAALLQSLMELGSDKPDMMDFAKETGKTLFENLELMERKNKIHEMINKLKIAINAEADIRFTLIKEEQLEKDSANRAKIAFLIGKSDEKTQALSILMLHFCSGLQHIQDLEDQEKENLLVEEIAFLPSELKE